MGLNYSQSPVDGVTDIISKVFLVDNPSLCDITFEPTLTSTVPSPSLNSAAVTVPVESDLNGLIH